MTTYSARIQYDGEKFISINSLLKYLKEDEIGTLEMQRDILECDLVASMKRSGCDVLNLQSGKRLVLLSIEGVDKLVEVNIKK